MSLPAAAPLASGPLSAPWQATPAAPSGTVRAEEAASWPGVWLAEIAVPATAGAPVPPPLGMPGALPLAAPTWPTADPDAQMPEVRVSDRGWIGEPDDPDAPHRAYPARLAEPPALELALPVYPDQARRALLAAGELLLLNGDGALDMLAGDWRLAGQRVRILRGPHRRPRHARMAEFGAVALLRSASGAVQGGDGLLRLPLRGAETDLAVPACEVYGGTGGEDGHADLAGQPKPRLYGIRRNIEPVLEDPARLIYRYHHGGPAAGVLAARDRGGAIAHAGDVPSYADLRAASPSPGTFITCHAAGCLRLGSVPSLLTIDARGDATPALGGYAGSPPDIAARLVQTAGGLGVERLGDFSWLGAEAGLWLRDAITVAEAMDRLAASVAGWWGTDAFGVVWGGMLRLPETAGPSLVIEPWMLARAPEEVAHGRPPWWRARVAYRPNGRVQVAEDLAGAVSAADRDVWGRPHLIATAADTELQARFLHAEDPPPVESLFDAASGAELLAAHLLALFGRPRRAFLATLAAWDPVAAVPGAVALLRWEDDAMLRAGMPLLVTAASLRGDRLELTLWG
ncbi:hypothetical protein [Crenalkalicoccus roseus]|uniref:hypothetical protein n=1 Tax=Crenalkalicoccus roseus TaxID=1485588 RepID=UPI001081375B|nr:hypothetical protein [Crenalkalicoccus roseus]